jgi:hypothetical protein
MKKITLFLLAFVLWNCGGDDEATTPVIVPSSLSYNFQNMLYPIDAFGNGQVTVDFINGVVVKRRGGLRKLDPAAGGGYFYDTVCYDDVFYSGNRITIEEGKLTTFPALITRTNFLVDAQGRITHKIDVSDDGFQTPADTLTYQYNGNQLVGSTRKRNSFHREESVYYYNAQKNLDSIVSREIYQDQLQRTTIEKFSNYDHAPNPLKKLFIFKETFLRSLSTNNFMNYEKSVINNAAGNEVDVFEERSWDIPHNAFGNIIF